jgi:hypothetical protein
MPSYRQAAGARLATITGFVVEYGTTTDNLCR